MEGINEHTVLPKLIVVVVDDDIIKNVPAHIRSSELQRFYEHILNSLLINIRRSIDAYKDILPNKAKRENIPHVLFIAPPSHTHFKELDNQKRSLFTVALANSVSLQKNMSMLKLLKIWNHEDGENFNKESNRYTATGLKRYWLSVDSAIKFWCTALSKKFDKKSNNKTFQRPNHMEKKQQQRYKWYSKKANSPPYKEMDMAYGNDAEPSNFVQSQRRRRYPTPP